MPRATKKIEPVDFESWKGLTHARCGSHVLLSGIEMPIGVHLQTDAATGRQFYVSGIASVEGTFEVTAVYLHRFVDNGEVKRIVLNSPKPRWGN